MAKVVTSDPDEPGLIADWMRQLEAGVPIRCARDQVFSPVDAGDVAEALTALALRGCTGIFHLGGPTALTRLEFLEMLVNEMARYRRIAPNIIRCSLRDLTFAEPRPLDASLSSEKVCRVLGKTFKDMRAVCREAVRRHYGGDTAAPLRRSEA